MCTEVVHKNFDPKDFKKKNTEKFTDLLISSGPKKNLFPPTWSEVGQEWHHRGVFLHLRCGEKVGYSGCEKNSATTVGIPSTYGATTVYRIDFMIFFRGGPKVPKIQKMDKWMVI